MLVQRAPELLPQQLAGVGAIEEGAGAAALHHLRPREARQVAEAVGAVDDREGAGHLGIAQHEVTVCNGEAAGKWGGWGQKGVQRARGAGGKGDWGGPQGFEGACEAGDAMGLEG